MLWIDATTVIPSREIWFEFAHAQGPGGQNVNKVASQVTLCFAVGQSSGLTPERKQRVFAALRNRINKEGVLRIVCRETRSQARNRALAFERFHKLLAAALRTRKQRWRTRVPRAAREQRLRHKRVRSEIKRQRRKVSPDEA